MGGKVDAIRLYFLDPGESSHDSDSEVEQGLPPPVGDPPTNAAVTVQPTNADLQQSVYQ